MAADNRRGTAVIYDEIDKDSLLLWVQLKGNGFHLR